LSSVSALPAVAALRLLFWKGGPAAAQDV
jgi:hypothetical protein